MMKHRDNSTSWEPVKKWYNDVVGKEGSYYHQQLVIPGVIRLLDLKNQVEPKVLDLACGQGVLGRALSAETSYCGIDLSPGFIRIAKQSDRKKAHRYEIGDITKPLALKQQLFSHAAIILALQNVEDPLGVVKNAAQHLQPGGRLVIVLNHPCFRIPRQSNWNMDEENKIRYRRINRYYSPLKIPIQIHPSQKADSPVAWTFHHPLSDYTHWLKESGFLIEEMEEWCSDKVSTGKYAKVENRSRAEFPLFLAISAIFQR